MNYVLLFLTAAAFSSILTPHLTRLGERAGIVDRPGERKIHTVAIPRLGGAAIALALTLTLGLSCAVGSRLTPALPDPAILLPIIAGAIVVFAVGLWDDLDPVSPVVKLAGQCVAAVIVVGSDMVITRVTVFGTVHELGMLAVPVTMLWIVGITNAFNLMDGLDGLAGGLVGIAAATCAAVLIVRGEQAGAMLLVALVGAVVGFLPYNFNPASVFLGDSGSLLSGFLLAVTAIMGRQKGATVLAAGVPLLIFALPIADMTLSVVRRLVGGQRVPDLRFGERLRALANPLRADKAHIHHRLLAVGLSHREAVLVLYALSVIFSALALLSMEVP